MAYLGLVPSVHSSGPTVRRGAITKAGNPHVRRLLADLIVRDGTGFWAFSRMNPMHREESRTDGMGVSPPTSLINRGNSAAPLFLADKVRPRYGRVTFLTL